MPCRPSIPQFASSQERKKCIWLQVGLAGPMVAPGASVSDTTTQSTMVVGSTDWDCTPVGATRSRMGVSETGQVDSTSVISSSRPAMNRVSRAHPAKSFLSRIEIA